MSAQNRDPLNPQPSSALTRRRVFAGAGAVGALAVVAAVVPSSPRPAEPATDAKRKLADAEAADGYQLTDHVLRYYQTARV